VLRGDRERLDLGTLEAVDLQEEAMAVDQEPDDDLRVDPAFLGVPERAKHAETI
jgi:hypothetical protein